MTTMSSSTDYASNAYQNKNVKSHFTVHPKSIFNKLSRDTDAHVFIEGVYVEIEYQNIIFKLELVTLWPVFQMV